MAALRLDPLETVDAQEYWALYVSGRTDVPTRSVPAHVERYLALPPDEQRAHYIIRLGDTMIGTVRLLPGTITGFALAPAHAVLPSLDGPSRSARALNTAAFADAVAASGADEAARAPAPVGDPTAWFPLAVDNSWTWLDRWGDAAAGAVIAGVGIAVTALGW